MVANDGEQVFEALLTPSYHSEIAEDGAITVTKEAQTIRGKVEHGAIVWSDRAQSCRVIQLAYVAKLRWRIEEFRGQSA